MASSSVHTTSPAGGIKSVAGDASNGGKDRWIICLLAPNSADPQTGKPLYEGEFETFIRIDGS